MAKNPLLSRVVRLLQLAQLAQKNGWNTDFLLEKVSRRKALKTTAQATAGLALLNAFPKTVFAGNHGEPSVVILGAGTAGLTAAYRLKQAGVSSTLYEGSYRVGGRMFTQRNFSDGMFCELGGELVDTDHEGLTQLCQELGLPLQDLRKDSEGLETDLFT